MFRKNGLIQIILILIICLVNIILFSDQELPHREGKAIIKVVEVFTDIHTRSDGIIETEQNWFNQIAIQYEIHTLSKMYNSNRELFRYHYVVEFPTEYNVLDVCATFNERKGIDIYSVYPSIIVKAHTNDDYYSYQWPLPQVLADSPGLL